MCSYFYTGNAKDNWGFIVKGISLAFKYKQK
jgi:hypothetical protein